VHTEQLVLVANATWARRLATRKEFRDVPVVTYDECDYVIGRWLGHHFGRRAPPWSSAAHVEELEEVLDLVRDGVGVAVVPGSVVTRRSRLATIGWGRPPVENTVYSVRRVGAPPLRALETVLAALRAL
jgi:DNA-binding transcriptional LysR family regulator